ncbi:unnamed protein product, partial [Allacma fusca]
MHVKESNGTLPKDIEDFLADVDQFVYISFGSIIRVSKLPLTMRKVLFEAVESMPRTKFLWKWEGEIPEDLPKNALAKNWFPQQDVLANPKCKGFVTQGETFSGDIRQLLENTKYSSNVKQAARRFKDRPMSAVDTAVWWT